MAFHLKVNEIQRQVGIILATIQQLVFALGSIRFLWFFLVGLGCGWVVGWLEARVLGQGRGGFCLRLRFVSRDSDGNCATCGSILVCVVVVPVCVCELVYLCVCQCGSVMWQCTLVCL